MNSQWSLQGSMVAVSLLTNAQRSLSGLRWSPWNLLKIVFLVRQWSIKDLQSVSTETIFFFFFFFFLGGGGGLGDCWEIWPSFGLSINGLRSVESGLKCDGAFSSDKFPSFDAQCISIHCVGRVPGRTSLTQRDVLSGTRRFARLMRFSLDTHFNSSPIHHCLIYSSKFHSKPDFVFKDYILKFYLQC